MDNLVQHLRPVVEWAPISPTTFSSIAHPADNEASTNITIPFLDFLEQLEREVSDLGGLAAQIENVIFKCIDLNGPIHLTPA
ncbi:hypothetical protein CC2G_011646 [Coprinopsis cinerea AmutBmut pab1-1]|nr:hypothetical protein CC2G_011646 [Coprinopsis cinerea AmutBmut pab1-1]